MAGRCVPDRSRIGPRKRGRAGGRVGWRVGGLRQSGVSLAMSIWPIWRFRHAGPQRALCLFCFCFVILLITTPMMDEDAGHMMPYPYHHTGMQHPTRKSSHPNIHATYLYKIRLHHAKQTVQDEIIHTRKDYTMRSKLYNMRLVTVHNPTINTRIHLWSNVVTKWKMHLINRAYNLDKKP